MRKWIEDQFQKVDKLGSPSEYSRISELVDIFAYLAISPECHWDKARTELIQLLTHEVVEKNWKNLDDEAAHWETGQGVFLSEVLTDFGAMPTAAALAALLTTTRLITEVELQQQSDQAKQRWWQRLTKSLWGHGLDTFSQRLEIIRLLDRGAVLHTKFNDSWIDRLRDYFSETIKEGREDPMRWGIGYIHEQVEALLRLGPLTQTYQSDIMSQIEPPEQEKIMEEPMVRVLYTNSLDKDTLAQLSTTMVRMLPPHRFRVKVGDVNTINDDVESTYVMKTLILREPWLNLMQDPNQQFSLKELIKQTNMDKTVGRIIIGHLLKSGLVDMENTEPLTSPWYEPKRQFHLSPLGAELIATAPATEKKS